MGRKQKARLAKLSRRQSDFDKMTGNKAGYTKPGSVRK